MNVTDELLKPYPFVEDSNETLLIVPLLIFHTSNAKKYDKVLHQLGIKLTNCQGKINWKNN